MRQFAALIAFASVLLTATALARAADNAEGHEANRLINTASPYLLQHAYNPIDWYPWGDEAFEKARRENKPIFLSIGYSTCHWCHVMARESFEDPIVAELLNRDYVAIKVDRERRPEVDEPYLLATQALTGRSGWPNNLLLTPELKPFFATIYEPRDTLLSLFSRGSELWQTGEADLRRDGDMIMSHVMGLMNTRREAKTVDTALVENTVSRMLSTHDDFNGGFAVTPKFPRESWLMLLLHDAEKNGNSAALHAVKLSVDNMLNGGIHDQLSGGFHRYAVDPAWRVPHFEKMLFTQAQMTRVLVRLYQLTHDTRYRDAARHTLDFVIRDMRDPQGGFYSAFDAEDAGGEGRFYTWSETELHAALPDAADALLAMRHFGVEGTGPHKGLHVPYIAETIAELAETENTSTAIVENAVSRITSKMLDYRNTRPAPALDTKVVLDWNAMMAIALAEAASAFDAPLYLAAARAAVNFIQHHMTDDNGQLLRVSFDGKAELPAQQRDHALLGLAQLALHDATGDPKWLSAAMAQANHMHHQFHDAEAGDYFMNAADSALPRYKSRDDSSFPSGNSMALTLLAKLATRSYSTLHRERADAHLVALSGALAELPTATSDALLAADRLQRGHYGPSQHLAQGRVHTTLHTRGDTLELRLRIADGWHINAHEPLEDYLTPTAVGWLEPADDGTHSVLDADMPTPVLKTLDYSPTALLLYDGEITITVPSRKPSASALLALTLQACSNEVCLPPTNAHFRIP